MKDPQNLEWPAPGHQLDLLVVNVPDIFWTTDYEGRTVFITPNVEKVYGFTPEEIYQAGSRLWFERVHPDDAERVQKAYESLFARNEMFDVEYRIQRKDGRWIWLHDRAIATYEKDGVMYADGAFSDITERVQAEEALRKERDFISAVLDTAGALVVVLDRQGRIVRFNPACEETTGYSSDEVVGKPLWDLFLIPEEVELVKAVFEELRAGQFPNKYENYWVTKDSKRRLIAWSNTAILDADGSVEYVIGTGIDVTERQQAEEALRKARDKLELRVEERTVELQERLAFERLITSASTEFINLGPEEIDAGIMRALEAIGQFGGGDRSYVFLFSEDGTTMDNTHEWCAEGIEPQIQNLQAQPVETLPWSTARIKRLETVHIPRVADLLPEARVDQAQMRGQDIQSLILVPMVYRGVAVGFLGFDSVRTEKTWSEDTIALLRIVGEIFVNALERKRAQEALQVAYQTLEQRVKERTHELAALNAISAVVSRSLDLKEIMIAALDKILEVMGLDLGVACRLEGSRDSASQTILEDDSYLSPRAYRGLSEEFLQRLSHLPLRGTMIERAATIGQPVVWQAAQYPIADLRQELQKEGIQLGISVPLLVKGKLVGAIFLAARTMRPVKPEELSLLAAVGQQVGVAIEKARLFEAEERRAEQFRVIGEVGRRMTSILPVDELLWEIARLVKETLGYYLVGIGLIEGDSLVFKAGAGGVWEAPQFQPPRLKMGQEGITGWVAQSGEPLLVPDVSQEPRYYSLSQASEIRSELAVPLKTKEAVIGVLHVQSGYLNAFDASDLVVLQSLANQAAIAIENAHLYKVEQDRREEAERRRQVAEGLREILAVLNSKQSLNETLDYIVTQACRLLGSDAASIFQLQGKDGPLKIQSACGLDADYVSSLSLPIGRGGAGRALAERQPVTLPNVVAFVSLLVREPDATLDVERVGLEQLVSQGYHALLSVPLIVKDEDYGAITLYYREPRDFSEEEIRLAMSVADQVALAIESARLREQAEQSAAITERSRLARELHDSVTQSLYSVTLYAEAAARLLTAGKSLEAADHLRELRDTAQEALREMRLLIFQLRPPALEKAGLAAALQARLDAVEVRGGIKAELQVEGTPNAQRLPFAVQEELYHIAQEALNNTLKHAKAQHVRVHLQFLDTATRLEVWDDGVGFEPAIAQEGGGMGLPGMKERVQKIGGKLQIESAPGKGTRVTIEVPMSSEFPSKTQEFGGLEFP